MYVGGGEFVYLGFAEVVRRSRVKVGFGKSDLVC